MTGDDLRLKRKIQQLGSSTLAVTLPVGWTREQELSKGDELVIQRDESGGSLLLVPDSPRTKTQIATLDGDTLDADSLERAMLAQYVLGRQLIRIEGDPPLSASLLETVTAVESQLMGLGIVEQRTDRIDVRCSIAPGDFELPTLLERFWRTESTLRADAVAAFVAGDGECAERADHYQRQLEKLFYLFLRLVFTTYRNPRLNHSVGLETGFPLIEYRSVAQDTVLMADHARRLVDMVAHASDPGPLDDGTAANFEAVADALDDAVTATRDAVSTPTHEATSEAREALTGLERELESFQTYLEDERPKPLLELQRALTALRSCGDHVEDTLEVATHFAFRSSTDLETEAD